MDRITLPEKLSGIFEKYKYMMLIVGIGLLLMMWPSGDKKQPEIKVPIETVQQISVAEELCSILSQIRGVGRVKVMLTEQSGSQTHYQMDESGSYDGDSSSSDHQTVIISSGSGEAGLIKSITPPVYLGAIVVCQGADDPAVRLSVSKAVSAVTGISTDRISVLKMK